jgi:hypothetical protein
MIISKLNCFISNVIAKMKLSNNFIMEELFLISGGATDDGLQASASYTYTVLYPVYAFLECLTLLLVHNYGFKSFNKEGYFC